MTMMEARIQHGLTLGLLRVLFVVPNAPTQVYAAAATEISGWEALCCINTRVSTTYSLRQISSCIARLETYPLFRLDIKIEPVRWSRCINADECRRWCDWIRAGRSHVTRSSDAVHQRPLGGTVTSESSPTTFCYPTTLVRRRAFIATFRRSSPRPSYGASLHMAVSLSCGISIAQTTHLVDVLEINVYIALLGAAIVLYDGARPPGVVAPGIRPPYRGGGRFYYQV